MIEVASLSRRYGRRWALADVSFRVRPGSVVMLTGRNGSGKSTLLRVLATAIRPDRGSARVGGFDVVTQREDVRRLTALLSHHNYLYESLTAQENLAVVAEHLDLPRSAVAPMLARVGLESRGGDLLSTFSAGMRKRLSFGRVLLQAPKVVLLDEPYGALDPEGFTLVEDVVHELKASNVTVLIATHQWERVGAYADERLDLEAGRLR
ncbi:MAG TPA: heme ABC exporter ATP-binding protein CcmA [Thermoanaerobaculia bacterium]